MATSIRCFSKSNGTDLCIRSSIRYVVSFRMRPVSPKLGNKGMESKPFWRNDNCLSVLWIDVQRWRYLEIDHIVPKSLGGTNTYGNCQVLHRHCHDQRHAKWAQTGITLN